MKLIIKHVQSYGQHRYYAACELSKLLCELLNRKSLTIEQIELIEKYGFEVIQNENH